MRGIENSVDDELRREQQEAGKALTATVGEAETDLKAQELASMEPPTALAAFYPAGRNGNDNPTETLLVELLDETTTSRLTKALRHEMAPTAVLGAYLSADLSTTRGVVAVRLIEQIHGAGWQGKEVNLSKGPEAGALRKLRRAISGMKAARVPEAVTDALDSCATARQVLDRARALQLSGAGRGRRR